MDASAFTNMAEACFTAGAFIAACGSQNPKASAAAQAILAVDAVGHAQHVSESNLGGVKIAYTPDVALRNPGIDHS